MTTQEQRNNAYDVASENIRNLYASSELGAILLHTFTALGLPQNRYREYAHIFGDAFLHIDDPELISKNLEMRFGLSPLVVTQVLQTVSSVIDPQIFSLPGITHTYSAPSSTLETLPDAPDPAMRQVVSETTQAVLPVTPPHSVSPTATPHIPSSMVMPHTAAEVAAAHDTKGTTALPNALLQNLKASLMHGVAPEEPLEGTGPKASYNSMLGQPQKPPGQ